MVHAKVCLQTVPPCMVGPFQSTMRKCHKSLPSLVISKVFWRLLWTYKLWGLMYFDVEFIPGTAKICYVSHFFIFEHLNCLSKKILHWLTRPFASWFFSWNVKFLKCHRSDKNQSQTRRNGSTNLIGHYGESSGFLRGVDDSSVQVDHQGGRDQVKQEEGTCGPDLVHEFSHLEWLDVVSTAALTISHSEKTMEETAWKKTTSAFLSFEY